MPGDYRVGYALMHKDLQKEYLKAITPFVCAKPSLAAARAALADTDHIDQVLEANEISKEFVLELLAKWVLSISSRLIFI